jgi:hypothetical protein
LATVDGNPSHLYQEIVANGGVLATGKIGHQAEVLLGTLKPGSQWLQQNPTRETVEAVTVLSPNTRMTISAKADYE